MKRLFFVLSMLLYSFHSFAGDYVPKQAFQYKDTIARELKTYFPVIPDYNYIPSLIEHESCVSLSHSKCWNPQSRLKTNWKDDSGRSLGSREEGAGLPQITRTWKKDGTQRFDVLSDMKRVYKTELRELQWDNIYQKPELQIRIMVLLVRDIYKRNYSVVDTHERLKMTDSAYNGGEGDLVKSRRVCGLAKNCNPQLWFNHVERYNVKSTRILYGNRSARDINNHHVRDVFINNLPKYQKQYFDRKDYL